MAGPDRPRHKFSAGRRDGASTEGRARWEQLELRTGFAQESSAQNSRRGARADAAARTGQSQRGRSLRGDPHLVDRWLDRPPGGLQFAHLHPPTRCADGRQQCAHGRFQPGPRAAQPPRALKLRTTKLASSLRHDRRRRQTISGRRPIVPRRSHAVSQWQGLSAADAGATGATLELADRFSSRLP